MTRAVIMPMSPCKLKLQFTLSYNMPMLQSKLSDNGKTYDNVKNDFAT